MARWIPRRGWSQKLKLEKDDGHTTMEHCNREELNILLSNFNPVLVFLQETFLKPSKTTTFKNCSFYNLPVEESNGNSHGAVAILVNNAILHSHIQLNTSLQAIAVRATCHKTIFVCSIYLFSSSKFNSSDFDNLITHLFPPILLLGDFSPHSSVWGCSKTDIRGKLVEDILLKHNLSLLNDGSYTYLHPATGSLSAIDLSIATPSLYLDFSWQVIIDQHGSDHFPIGICSYATAPPVTNGTWKLSKANWTTFSSKASTDLGRNYPNDLEDPIEHFTDILTNIANSTIPKSKPRSKKRDPVWLNDECMNSICSRRKTTRKVKTSFTPANIENLRIVRAKARCIRRSTKRKCWQSFVSKINSRTSIKKVWTVVRKITGYPSTSPIRHLKVDFLDIANTIWPRLSQTIHHLKTTAVNSNLSITRQKTNSSNLNPATMKITTINFLWMNSLMLYLNLMIQLLARMMSTTKCLNTSVMMLFSPYSTFLITSGLWKNSLQAGVLLQLY